MNELETIKKWFEIAIPEPTTYSACVQIGCAYEETAELATTLNDLSTASELGIIADSYKNAEIGYMLELDHLSHEDQVQMLDDIVDEIVTRVGIAHNMGFDIIGALQEVNRSNFSKFEGGKAVFDENGKIRKGKDYTPPNLESFV